jgi:hypothetical protein
MQRCRLAEKWDDPKVILVALVDHIDPNTINISKDDFRAYHFLPVEIFALVAMYNLPVLFRSERHDSSVSPQLDGLRKPSKTYLSSWSMLSKSRNAVYQVEGTKVDIE